VRLINCTPAKEFHINDIFGNSVTLDNYKGKRLLLSFLRFTGCPICNLHVHQWLERKQHIEDSNLNILIVLESPTETIRSYVDKEKLPFTFISDPQNVLYNIYQVETSWVKYFLMLFSLDIWLRAFKGWSRYSAWSSMKGTMNRIEAEFLIDENGTIVRAQYGEKIGDYIPLEEYLY
jgi:peroxiredoxin